jgi:hypothetical protein
MTIDDVVAREEIRSVLLRYHRAMDQVDDELGASIFHEDGTGDYGPDIFSGSGRELIRWLNEYNRTLVTSHHQMSNVSIEVEGDRAASETYVTATLIRPEGDDYVVRSVYGRYIDRLSRRGGRWAIDHRHYRRDFYYEQSIDGVVVGASAARDGSDESYRALGEIADAR